MKATKKVSKKIVDGKPVYAIVYSRVSTRLWSEQKMRQQEQQCVKFAQAQGYIVKKDAIFREIASGTGRYQKRPVLVKILEYIERFHKKQFILIVTDMQRISRDKRNASAYRKALFVRTALVESLNCPSKQSIEDQMRKIVDYLFKWHERNVVYEWKEETSEQDRPGVDPK